MNEHICPADIDKYPNTIPKESPACVTWNSTLLEFTTITAKYQIQWSVTCCCFMSCHAMPCHVVVLEK